MTIELMERIQEIETMPTMHEGIHESVFRGPRTLELIIELLEIGTPVEIVLNIAKYLERRAKGYK